MFLTAPTIEELKLSDIPELVDMLSRQTMELNRLLKDEGASFKTIAIRKMILDIQAAIDAKKNTGKQIIRK